MEQKRLYRSVTNRKICGVCGGLGEYFNIDPTIDPAWRCFAGLRKLWDCRGCLFCCSSYHSGSRIKNKRALPIKKRQKEKKSEVMFPASFIITRYKCIKSVIGETL